MKWYEKLKFARQVKGLALREVEKETGISNAYLCQIENGGIDDPSYFKIIKLLKFYNLNHKDFDEAA